MKTGEPKRISLYWAVAFAIIAAVVIHDIARADDDHHCQGNSCNGSDGDVTATLSGGDLIGGDINTGGNKSVVLAPPGLSDVDIAQCLGSTSWSLIVGAKQKLVLNQVCMAEFYLKRGRYDLAAQALCNQPEILMEYKTEVACEIDHDFSPTITAQPVSEDYVTEDELDVADAQINSNIENLVAQVYERIEALEHKPAPRPRVVQAPEQQQYLAKDFLMSLRIEDEDE